MKNTAKAITVLAAPSREMLDADGAWIEDTHCQTVAEAKKLARYFLSEQSLIDSESTTPMGYVQVLVNGECLYDYFAK